MNIKDKNIIFWFNQPPKVELGAYNYLSTLINGKTYYFCYNDLPDERKNLNWGNVDYGNAQLKIINKIDNTIDNKDVDTYLSNEYIHIVCGLSGAIANYICPKLKSKNIKFIVVSERPRIVFNKCKDYFRSTLLYIKHWTKYIKYNSDVLAFLALGEKGVNQFKKIGWSEHKLFQFMYCGNYDSLTRDESNLNKNKEYVKFIYIGRFNYIHGLDILMKSFNSLKNSNWYLDLAGGYGELKNEVLQWCNGKEQVSFIGMIDSKDVRQKMQEYDVVLVPSRMDGWNCQVNEAISAGVPLITTDEAVSSELVTQSEAGISIKKINYKNYANKIDILLKDINILNKWKENCNNYQKYIRKEIVGTYLYNILNYVYCKGEEKPKCPWILKNK